MIKAIAFDLMGVLVDDDTRSLTPLELALSETFDYKVGNELYWQWAMKKTGKDLEKTKQICWDIINKIYRIKEPDMFEKIPKLKYALASNHLSIIADWLKEKGIYENFYCCIISEEIKFQKPDPEFYRVLIEKMGEKPQEVLFVDDKIKNVEGADKAGLRTLLYNNDRLLSREINEFLKDNEG